MKNLIEVSVDSIRIHMPTAQHLVILKEKEADRYLPIWIGSFEAQAIATKISGNPLGRPLTHDLMATAFGHLGISVKRIVCAHDAVWWLIPTGCGIRSKAPSCKPSAGRCTRK